MKKLMRIIRLTIWGFVALVLAYFLVTQYLVKRSGVRVDHVALAREGGPVAEALYAFKADCGLWPEYLEDLVPQYLKAAPLDWDYRPGRQLRRISREDASIVLLDLTRPGEGWQVLTTQGERPLGVSQGVGPRGAATWPAERIVAKQLAEYGRRIKREPQEMEHYRGEASVLLQAGRTPEAQAVCRQAQEAASDHWWPRLALATLAGRSAETLPGTLPAASPDTFAAWVAANPSFTHYLYLAAYWRDIGQLAPAAQAIRTGLQYPLTLGVDDSFLPEFYLFDAARIAYAAGDYPLVLTLCDQWEKLGTEQHRPEGSYLALRAAAQLALGQTDPARTNAAAALARHQQRPLWARHLEALQQAAQQGDRGFHYDSGDLPGKIRAFDK